MKIIQTVTISAMLLLGTHVALGMKKEDNPLLTKIREERIETISEFEEVVRLLGEQSKPLGNSILHNAVLLGQYKIVQQLLEQKVDPNILNFVNGKSPLFFAARTDIANLLLRFGAQVTLVDKSSNTMLHDEPSRYLPEMTEWFIAHGTDVNAVNKQGQTPLHEARRKECAEQLLAHGAKLDNTDDSENTPLHNAASAGLADLVGLFIEGGAGIDARGYAETTPLHQAALNGNKEAADVLVKNGADVSFQDLFGMTPAQCAEQKSYSELAQILRLAEKK